MIEDIITGQYNDPSRIIAFNMAEGWARDVTEDVARARSVGSSGKTRSYASARARLWSARQAAYCPRNS